MVVAKFSWLVFSTHLKNISQNGNLPQRGVKIKNIWNHLLASFLPPKKCWKVTLWTNEWVSQLQGAKDVLKATRGGGCLQPILKNMLIKLGIIYPNFGVNNLQKSFKPPARPPATRIPSHAKLMWIWCLVGIIFGALGKTHHHQLFWWMFFGGYHSIRLNEKGLVHCRGHWRSPFSHTFNTGTKQQYTLRVHPISLYDQSHKTLVGVIQDVSWSKHDT